MLSENELGFCSDWLNNGIQNMVLELSIFKPVKFNCTQLYLLSLKTIILSCVKGQYLLRIKTVMQS